MALVACAPPARQSSKYPETELRARFEQLHRRLYEVYALDGERDALWGFLAESFAGEALTGEYVEHFTALRRMARESTAIRVLEVGYDQIAVHRDGDGWLVDADWSVGGVVTHQGHRHPRINRYRATYRLASTGGAREDGLADLRIVGTTLRSLERVASARGAGFPLDDLPASTRGSLSVTDLIRAGAVEPPAPSSAEKPPDEPPGGPRP
jgi:hypothetical protein